MKFTLLLGMVHFICTTEFDGITRLLPTVTSATRVCPSVYPTPRLIVCPSKIRVASAKLRIDLSLFTKISNPNSISVSIGATYNCTLYQQLPIFNLTGPTTDPCMDNFWAAVNSLTSRSLRGGRFIAWYTRSEIMPTSAAESTTTLTTTSPTCTFMQKCDADPSWLMNVFQFLLRLRHGSPYGCLFFVATDVKVGHGPLRPTPASFLKGARWVARVQDIPFGSALTPHT
ncbi:hypothetical protein DPMN_087780 [Dreissena polymorpha]|uniref:Uncharacterized protein n=1 Tax=Dreissena polymorpha TaxID=45954 RepID=A0A9D4KTL3_DREPO|nr:hypothetical protein DPMN_087780 [Dreissena polymorpha]